MIQCMGVVTELPTVDGGITVRGINFTNHTNFNLPGNSFPTTTFGVIGSAREARDLRFGLKIYF